MQKIQDSVAFEITKLWFAQQDLHNLDPEKASEIFFEAYYKIKKANVKKWD